MDGIRGGISLSRRRMKLPTASICKGRENNPPFYGLEIFCPTEKGRHMDFMTILEIAAIIVAVYLFLKLLSAPFKLAIKLLMHAGLGFLLLLIEELIAGFFNFSLGITFINCLVAGVFGIPGVVVLILIKLFL